MGGLDMTAAALLARVEGAGVTVEADGDRLRITASAPPPPALLHELGGLKAELLALLERHADEAAEREAIQGEPALPLVGTVARERLEAGERLTLAGLRAVANGGTQSHG
jgi:hypothetical protein